MNLTPELLISAYAQGVFPMAHEDGRILWFDPDPRAVLPLERFHASRRLLRTVRQGGFDVRVDTAFTAVMRACAANTPDREETWINDELIAAYTRLHQLGFAHSVEAWQGGKLVGGLYGVGLRGLFAGESMFSLVTDASKVALVHLVWRLRAGGFRLLDVQFLTEHLRRFGAVEISQAEYKRLLAQALSTAACF